MEIYIKDTTYYSPVRHLQLYKTTPNNNNLIDNLQITD